MKKKESGDAVCNLFGIHTLMCLSPLEKEDFAQCVTEEAADPPRSRRRT